MRGEATPKPAICLFSLAEDWHHKLLYRHDYAGVPNKPEGSNAVGLQCRRVVCGQQQAQRVLSGWSHFKMRVGMPGLDAKRDESGGTAPGRKSSSGTRTVPAPTTVAAQANHST